MKAVGVNSIERTLTFAGSMANAFPGILDNINPDKAIRIYSEVSGSPAEMMVDENVVQQSREIRAQQAQAQQMLASAQQGAEITNKMANAPLSDDNALSQLLSNMQAGGQ